MSTLSNLWERFALKYDKQIKLPEEIKALDPKEVKKADILRKEDFKFVDRSKDILYFQRYIVEKYRVAIYKEQHALFQGYANFEGFVGNKVNSNLYIESTHKLDAVDKALATKDKKVRISFDTYKRISQQILDGYADLGINNEKAVGTIRELKTIICLF